MSSAALLSRANTALLSRASCGRPSASVRCSSSAMPVVSTRMGCPRRAPCPAQRIGRPARIIVRAMASTSDISNEAYVCMGLAQCFQKKDGTLAPVLVLEPLSASSLECLANGARTSYKQVTGVTFGDAMRRNKEALPEGFRDAPFCENFEYRLEAATRTWLRPHAQDNLMDIVPLGKARGNFNFSLEDKRVLNFENVVSDSDNVKQDMSIDVYGRGKADDYAAKQLAVTEAKAAEVAVQDKKQKEEEDLDALLMA